MMNLKSIPIAVLLGLSHSFLFISNPLKAVKKPVMKIYTYSQTPDLDFFNPNRKVAYSPLKINHYENYLIHINQINS